MFSLTSEFAGPTAAIAGRRIVLPTGRQDVGKTVVRSQAEAVGVYACHPQPVRKRVATENINFNDAQTDRGRWSAQSFKTVGGVRA